MMGEIKQKLLLLILLALTINGYAQDLHFSQYYAAPLSINPALTGNFAEDYRFSTIYRSQWRGINSAFETTALGGEVNFSSGRLKTDKVGAGLYMYRDNLAGNLLVAQSVTLSLAYHHTLDVYKRHRISGGLQAGYVQKSIDASKLAFADQYIDFEVVPGLASGEPLIQNQISHFTFNIGAMYSYKVNPKADWFLGVSVFQLNSPKESFFMSGSQNKLNPRYTAYAGVNVQLNDLLALSPRVLYMNQEKGMDLNPGAALDYKLGKQKQFSLYLGGWYRLNDAAILMAGTKWKNYTIRLSYDATTSTFRELKKASNVNGNPKTGAFELSFILTGKLSGSKPDSFTVPCGIL